jgi:hypothetical protein
MATDSFFATAVAGMIVLLFGSLLLFGGYRLFMVLLPIIGFFFGFVIGAESVQALFGQGFLSTLTSWLVGFALALLFALLSYLFYAAAVALAGGALGYGLMVGLLMAIGFNFGLIVWTLGLVAAIIVGAATILLNVQKWVVILATVVLGAATILGAFLFLFGGLSAAELSQNPVRTAMSGSFLWTLMFIVLAGLGFVAQFESTRRIEYTTYNRLSEWSSGEPLSTGQEAVAS